MAELDIMEKLSKLGWGSEAADAVRFFYSIVRVRYIRGINEANYPDRPWWAWYGVFLENDQTSQKYYGALPPLESDWQKDMFEALANELPESLAEYMQMALPGRVKNEKFYDVLSQQYDRVTYQCYCTYLLLSIPPEIPLDDAYKQYLDLFEGKGDPLGEGVLQKLFCLMNWREIRDDSSVKAAAKEANELLTRMLTSNQEKCRIMDEIIRHTDTLKQKSVNAPAAYLSKLLYDDSKVARGVAATREINKLIKLVPKSLTFMEFLTAMMSANSKSENLAELGFLLPWLKSHWCEDEEIPVCLVNAMPTFMEAWGMRACDSATVPYDTAKASVSKALDATIYDMTELESIVYADKQRVLYFPRSYNTEEVRKHLLALCRENAVVVAVLPDTYKAQTISIPGYEVERIAILPEKLYKNGLVKNFVVKLIPAQTQQPIMACDVSIKTIDRRHYLEPESCWTKSLLKKVDYESNQTLRRLFYQTVNKKEDAVPRNRPKAYVYSPELTLWYTAKANSEEENSTYTVGLYLCEVPSEAQKKRNKFPRGKRIDSTKTWTTKVTQDQIEPWIENRGVFKENLRRQAEEQIVLYSNKVISLKSLWYLLYDKLDSKEEEKELLSRFARSGHGAGLMIGQVAEEEIERAIDEENENTDELVALLDKLFDLALRRKWIKAHPFAQLHSARSLQKKREESIRKLAKRNYTTDEELKIWSYYQENSGDIGAVGMILCFLTGLTPPYVAALTWRDWRRITYTEHTQLIINKKLSPDGSIVWQTEEENCRLIPVMDRLTQILDDVKNRQVTHPDDCIINLEEGALSAIRRQIRAAERYAGIAADMISVPDAEKELDLNRYEGSRMRSNFEWHCYMDCGMTDAEVHHLLLRVMPDTLSKNYVDYGHECMQERMAVKLNQWGQRFSDRTATAWKSMPLLKKKIWLKSHRGETESYQLSAQIHGRFDVLADSDHDFEYRLLVRSMEAENGN